jgi:acetyl-CoA hydrolase
MLATATRQHEQATGSPELRARIRDRALHARIMGVEDVIPFFHNGMNIGWSGFGANGCPKAVPLALADHVERHGLQGRLRFNVFTGGSVQPDVENRWVRARMIDRRWPYQLGEKSREAVNNGAVRMGDRHLSLFAEDLFNGFYTAGGKLDLGVVEATGITEEGDIILSTTVAAAPEIVHIADKVIVELNTALPSFEGMHDIPALHRPPAKEPYLIRKVDDRIGTAYVPCGRDKVLAIVESRAADNGPAMNAIDEISERIAGHIVDFFLHEVKHGRLPRNLLPLQSGIGNIGNAVIAGLAKGPFHGLQVWSEVVQDSMLEQLETGKMSFASSSGLALSNAGFKRLYEKWDLYRTKLVLRPQQISNGAELIRRLGVIAMNTPIEIDIYGHANSTHANGSRLINGIGGSGDYNRNSYVSILHTPSVRPSRSDPAGITTVVPMVTHVDHTEHDLHVFVTEQGLADMRGLCPTDRAQLIIDRCAHPDYRPILQEYLDRAKEECLPRAAGHMPHILPKVFRMHQHLVEHGTMKIASWA